MTENKKTIGQLLTDCNTEIDNYNLAIKSNKASAILETKKKASEAITAFNKARIHEDFDGFLSLANPVIAALTQLNIECKKMSEKKTKDTLTEDIKTSAVLGELSKQITLTSLDAYAKETKGSIVCKDIAWTRLLKEFCDIMAYRTAIRINNKEAIKKLSEIAIVKDVIKAIADKKANDKIEGSKPMADPLSNGSLEKRLQKVIDAIVGVKALKAKAESLEYINELMSRRGSSGQVISATTQWMETLIVDALNKIIVKQGFTIELNGKKDETTNVNSTDTVETEPKTDNTTTDETTK